MELDTIGKRLGYARELSGLSQRQLAARAGLKSATHVGLIEDEEREDPQSSTMGALAAALGISLDWLIRGEGPMPTREEVRSATDIADPPAPTDSQAGH